MHGPGRLDGLGKLAQRKAGLVALHWAIGTKPAEPIDAFQKLLGGCHGGPDRKYKFLETTFSPVAQPHAVTRGLEPIKLSDEFYYQLKFVQDAGLSPLVQVEIDGQPQTVSWAWQRPDGGRSFGFSGLHVHDNWRQPSYRRLITQGIRWTLGLDIPENGIALPDLPEEDFVLSTKAPSANP